jgi:hypothetical protein
MQNRLTIGIDLAKSAIGAFDVTDGMRWLLNRLGDSELDPRIRKKLSQLKYAADARLIQERIARLFARHEVNARSTELYFGLDPLNMPQGKGIEFGCGEQSEEYSSYPGNVRSDVLNRMFTLVEGGIGEIALGIGYLGLALKQAFGEISLNILLGAASHRRVVFGFHDGDLLELGEVTGKGFALSLEFSPPDVEGKPELSVKFPWPGEGSGRAEWLCASGLIAVGIEDEDDRASETTTAAKLLCEMSRFREAEHLVQGLIAIEGRLGDAGQRVKILACAANVAAGLGDAAAAGNYLRRGKAVVAGIEDQYWRERAATDLVWCADLLGMLESLGTSTSDERVRAEVAKGLVEAETELRAGGNVACRRKLPELDAKIRRETGIIQDRHRSRLLELCDKAGDSLGVLGIYESVPRTAWKWWDVVGPLWRHGAREEASKWLEDQFSDAENDQLLSNTGNQHHPMRQMERVARTYWKLGDSDRFQETLQRIERNVHAGNLGETGWVSAAVFTTLGRLQAIGGKADAARSTFLRAREAVAGERIASSRKQGWKELSAAYCDLDAWNDAVVCANKIRDPNTKRESIAKVYLRANRWNDLTAILDSVKDAAEASRLAFWLSWVFAEQ